MYQSIGDNYQNSKLLLVLHNADDRILEHEDYRQVLGGTKTGKTLNTILRRSHLTLEDVAITNMVKCTFPNNKPTKESYQNCSGLLENQVKELNPQAIITFGQPTYQSIFNDKQTNLTEAKAIENTYQDIPILSTIHPYAIWAKINPEKQKPYIEKIQQFLLKHNITEQIHIPEQQQKLF